MLRFTVNGQTLTRVDKFNPATDSEGYLQARFEFSADWAGTAKVAQFRDDITGKAYQVALDGTGACKVPAEVLVAATRRNYFVVNVYGVSNDIPRVTTNELRVDVKLSGYGPASTPADPTPDVYQQILAGYGETQASNERLAEACGDSIIVFDPLFTEQTSLYNVDCADVVFSGSRWRGTFNKMGAYSVIKYLFEAGRKYLLNARVFGKSANDTQTGRFSYFTTSYGWGSKIADYNAPDGGSDFVSCILEPSESSWLAIFSNDDTTDLPFEVELYVYDVTDMPDKVLSRVDFSTVAGKTSFSVADQALYVSHADTADVALSVRGKWYGKKAWICGDSITDYGWYPSRLATALGLAEFYQDGHSGQAISGCVADIVASPSLLGGYDLLTIFAGTNDFGGNKELGSIGSAADTSTTYGSLKLTIKSIVAANPNLRVVFFTPLPRGAFETQPGYGAENGRGYTLTDYCKAVKEVCTLYHIPVVDLYNLIGWNEFNITTKTLDGLHPTQEHTISDMVPLMAAQLNCL